MSKGDDRYRQLQDMLRDAIRAGDEDRAEELRQSLRLEFPNESPPFPEQENGGQ